MSLSTTIPPQFAPVSGSAYGTLGGASGYAADSVYGAGGTVASSLPGLIGVARSDNLGTVTGTLTAAVGESYGSGFDGKQYNTTTGVLPGISGSSEGGGILTPSFAVANGYLQMVTGFGIALGGQAGGSHGVMLGARGFATTSGNAEVRSDPGTVDTIDGNGDWNGREGGYLRSLTGVGYSADSDYAFVFASTTSKIRLFSLGHTEQLTDANGNPVAGYGVHAAVPVPTLVAQGGTAVKLTLPVPTLTCSGTTTVLGKAAASLPVPSLAASGTTTIVSRTQAQIQGKPTLVARGGARAKATLPIPTLVASGTTSRLAHATGTIPALVLSASGTTGVTGSVAGLLAGLSPGQSGVVVVSTPRVILRASGRPAVTIDYEGYSVALLQSQDGAVATATTHYTNFPFDRIVRFGSKYYGIAADGIYELAGDDFNGTPIVSVVQTAESDFGKKQRKRPTAAWVAGDLSNDLRVSCLVDGEDVSGVKYRERIEKGNAARRVVFGKGLRGHWLAYKFTNASGNDFTIEEFDPEVDVLRREV